MTHAKGVRPGLALLLAACTVSAMVSLAPGQEPARTVRSPFVDWDKDRDGFLTAEEFPDRFPKTMFDEIDEGTAIFKCSNEPPVGDGVHFLDYEGLPSDHYLRLTGEGGKLLRGELLGK